jgi:hypothetical protein
MSVEAISIPAEPATAQRADRLFYVFMAGLFVTVAALGFAPRSVAILSGTVPGPAAIVHVHAALMASWLLLLLAQTSLMATGRRRLHQALGAVSFVLAPLMLVLMLVLTFGVYYVIFTAGLDSLGQPPPLEVAARSVAFSLFVQGRAALLFAIFYVWAVRTRRSDSETHKRMMLLATFAVIDAALGRMSWLHDYSGPASDVTYAIVNVYQLLLLAPAIVFDLVRFGRVHKAYWVGIGLFLPFMIAVHVLWTSPAWQRAVGSVFGLS